VQLCAASAGSCCASDAGAGVLVEHPGVAIRSGEEGAPGRPVALAANTSSSSGNGHVTGEAILLRAIAAVVRSYAEKAGYDPDSLPSNMVRGTILTNLEVIWEISA